MSDTKKILLVEDNKGLRLFMKKTLEKLKYEVIEAANGKEGISLLSVYEDIKLVLLDIMMPVMNGEEFLNLAKKVPNREHFKICMTTALGMEEDIVRCLKAGADDYLVKPIDKELLQEKLASLLNEGSKSVFPKIETNFDGEILRLNKNSQIMIKELSENEIVFNCRLKLPLGAKIKVASEKLFEILGSEKPIIMRLYSSSEVDSDYLYRATFIGLQEEAYKKIRSVTTKGVAIHE